MAAAMVLAVVTSLGSYAIGVKAFAEPVCRQAAAQTNAKFVKYISKWGWEATVSDGRPSASEEGACIFQSALRAPSGEETPDERSFAELDKGFFSYSGFLLRPDIVFLPALGIWLLIFGLVFPALNKAQRRVVHGASHSH